MLRMDLRAITYSDYPVPFGTLVILHGHFPPPGGHQQSLLSEFLRPMIAMSVTVEI